MSLSFIAAHSLLDRLVRRKVDCMRRAWLPRQLFCLPLPYLRIPSVPAPTITLDTPRHNALMPSTLDIVAIALETPVYTAAGVGLTTCIRVYNIDDQYVTMRRWSRESSL